MTLDMLIYDTHHLLPRTNEPATAAPREGLFGRTKLKVRCFSVVWMGVVVVSLPGVVVSNNLPPEVGRKIGLFALAPSVRALWCLSNFCCSLLPSAQLHHKFRDISTARSWV